jgi:hypothetical protein
VGFCFRTEDGPLLTRAGHALRAFSYALSRPKSFAPILLRSQVLFALVRLNIHMYLHNKERKARTGKVGQYRQTGRPERDRQHRIGRKLKRTSRTGQMEHDKPGQAEHE